MHENQNHTKFSIELKNFIDLNSEPVTAKKNWQSTEIENKIINFCNENLAGSINVSIFKM